MAKKITVLKKNKTWFLVDDDNEIKLDADTMIKYRLKNGDTVNLETWKNMLLDNSYFLALSTAYQILKWRKTGFELKESLAKKQFPESVIKQVLHKVTEQKFIDDEQYIKDYIEAKKYQYGPKMMMSKLEQKGLEKPLIVKNLKIDEREIVSHLVPKVLKKKTNKTKKQIIQSTRQHFYAKGFSLEIIDQILYEESQSLVVDTKVLLEKAYTSLIRKLKQTENRHELREKIVQKLLTKGFTYEEIKAYLNQKNEVE
ncbi:MAG: RecX family transcriptional regulator [Acholeplasmataceae bacterium]